MRALMEPRKESKCIHCHDVKVAELKHRQQQGQFSRDLIFTYPAPSAIGLDLDADLQTLVRGVTPASPAQRAGVQPGDRLVAADGQRLLTFADLTRVLELTPSKGSLPLEWRRGSETIKASLELSGSWRRTQDPSWRESLHVAGPGGGFWGQKLAAEDRPKLGLRSGGMAVKVMFIWGDHPRRAGIKENDIVVKFDGREDDLTIAQLHAHLNLDRNYGDRIPLTVRRDGKDVDLVLELPPPPPSGG
jgi:S1-C subfamily serine protease